jgi:hypothetical protein
MGDLKTSSGRDADTLLKAGKEWADSKLSRQEARQGREAWKVGETSCVSGCIQHDDLALVPVCNLHCLIVCCWHPGPTVFDCVLLPPCIL